MTNNIEVEIVIKENPNTNTPTRAILFSDKNNISNKSALSIRTDGQNPFLLGISKLGDGSRIYNEYSGIISRTLSDENGNVNDYTIDIVYDESQTISYALYFDNMIDEYPTELVIDGETVYNDNSFIYINKYVTYSSSNDCFSIIIKKWSKPNRPIILNAMLEDVKDIFTSKTIKNLSIGTQIESDNTKPNFGLIGKFGSLSLVDKGEILSDYIDDGLLKENNPVVSIKYNNHYIGRFFSRNWQQDEKSKTFSMDLYDRVEKFDGLMIPKLEYQANKTAFDLFVDLFSYTGLENYTIDDNTKSELCKISIKDCYTTGEKSLLSLFNDFCNLTTTSLFINENNYLEVVKYV